VLESAWSEGRAARHVAALASTATASPAGVAAPLNLPSIQHSPLAPAASLPVGGRPLLPAAAEGQPGSRVEAAQLPAEPSQQPQQPWRSARHLRQHSSYSLASTDSELGPADWLHGPRMRGTSPLRRQGNSLLSTYDSLGSHHRGEVCYPTVDDPADVHARGASQEGAQQQVGQGQGQGQEGQPGQPEPLSGARGHLRQAAAWDKDKDTARSSLDSPDSPGSSSRLGAGAVPHALPSQQLPSRGPASRLAAARAHQHGGWACGIPIAGWLCANCTPAVLHDEGARSRRWEPVGPPQQHGAPAHGFSIENSTPAQQTPRRDAAAAAAAAAAPLERSGLLRALSQQGTRSLPASVGQGVPALAVRRGSGCAPQPVLCYFGIIDFLQQYTVLKRVEHSWKALVQDGAAVSVTDPRAYRRRFLAAMEKLFVVAADMPPQ
jgi:hypothetical protein